MDGCGVATDTEIEAFDRKVKALEQKRSVIDSIAGLGIFPMLYLLISTNSDIELTAITLFAYVAFAWGITKKIKDAWYPIAWLQNMTHGEIMHYIETNRHRL